MNRLRLRAEKSAKEFYQRRQNEPVEALVGDGAGTVDASGRLNWVWVRVRGDSDRVAVAYNASARLYAEDDSVNLLWVKRTGIGYYAITGYSGAVAYDIYGSGPGDETGTGVKAHEWQHERRDQGAGGSDPLDVYGRMLVPLRARPQTTPDMTMYVEAGYNQLTGNYFAGGNSGAFTAPITSGQSRIDLLYMDDADTLQILAGTPVGGWGTPTVPALPATCIPLAFVNLTYGQTTIEEGDIYRDARITAGGLGLAGVPASPDHAVQYNDAGAFGAVALNATATKKYLQQVSSAAPSFAQIDYADLSGTPAAPAALPNPTIEVSGVLAVAQNVGAYIVTQTQIIRAVYIYCRTPGTASSTIVDVRKNGITIFQTTGNRPTLAYNDADKVAKSAQPNTPNLVENDVLEFDIDQVATGAADLTIEVALTDTAVAALDTQLLANPNPGSVVDECVCRAVANGKVYWSSHRAQNPDTANGHEYAWDGAANSDIQAQAGQAGWQSVYNYGDGKIYVVGQIYADTIKYRAAVWTINVATDAVSYTSLNDTGHATGDCNELIGVLDDGTQLVAGERAGGGTTTGSNYPNGGGLWTIPKATIGTASTFTRVYEDTNSPTWEWTFLCKYGSTYYALLNSRAGDGKYVIQHSSDLTSWTVDVDGSALSLGQDVVNSMIYHAAQDKLYAATVNSSRQLVLREYNGSAWSATTFTGITIPATGSAWFALAEYLGDLLMILSKTSPSNLHDMYTFTNLSGTPSSSSRYSGQSNNGSWNTVTNGADIYYATVHAGGLNRAR